VGTTTLTKSSLRYIDMPTQTVLKSAKLIPVMLGSVVILRRSFSAHEWLSALMLCTGVVVFNLSTHLPSASQTAIGGVCILIALMCDALLGNGRHKPRPASSDLAMLCLPVGRFACGWVCMWLGMHVAGCACGWLCIWPGSVCRWVCKWLGSHAARPGQAAARTQAL
jgi:drug/metabolite transporter (DMT)-like permease